MTTLTRNESSRAGFPGRNRHFSLSRLVSVILGMVLFAPTLVNAQACRGNPNTGCSHSGALCSPVTTGSGSQGHCNTPKGLKGGLSCECAGTPIPPAPLFDIISRPTPPSGTDVAIRIDRPNPKQPSTEYPQITFQPGDTVTIHAGGCVQGGATARLGVNMSLPPRATPGTIAD